MVGSLVKATIQELLYSLLSLNFFRTNKFRIGLLEDLRIVLQYLTVMVDEAEEKQNKNPVVKLWLVELQDVVYHTEDLVDEMCTESLRHKLDAESQTKSSSLEWNIKVIKKMEEMLDRDADKDAIISLLLSDDVKSEQLSVIPIVGEVGVGWESLQSTLTGVANGSCVIVTTRDSEVASKISTGYEFEKEKLVLLWMAEGLPQNRGKEDDGNKCFDELLSESFFQQSSAKNSRFLMHDLVDDLAAHLSWKHFSRLEDNNSSHISVSTLYLSLCRGKYDYSVIFESIDKAKFLRTFLPIDHESCCLSSNELQNMLCKLQFLRVLSLSHYHITELPASIGNLKHLRFIDLSHTGIRLLPDSVCGLCNLKTLILSNCHSLTKLPENMWRLINLRHLDISGTDLSRLKRLQTPPYFVVGKRSGSMLKELGGLRDLHGTLHISKLQNVVSENDPVGARLFTKKYLDELVLEWSNNTVDQENVLEALQPNSKMKKLSINFYCGTRFPNWVGHMLFSGMVSLRLSNSNNCSSMPPLGQLPSLEVLIIEWMDAVKSVGPEFCGMDKPFKSLKTLTFEGMSEWEEWVSFEVGGGEFPSLIELCIRRCPKLKGNLPKQLPSVVKVEISESQELVTAIMTEASLHKRTLHYQEKVLFISEDKVASFLEQMTVFTYKGATDSSLPITKGAAESSLPMTTPNFRDEADVPTNNWSNQGRQYCFERTRTVWLTGDFSTSSVGAIYRKDSDL
ncbi:putative disease resistance RPP13-like protein 1 [Quercus lobata]|uniref:putative disease resistance RPP13-like protein 1 n=1 Tax=Quercus lobata TaxID=97700 RepID=UPI0012457019|nr:putative disease resistance RPP13-like protein 1 [Quercus lobata]